MLVDYMIGDFSDPEAVSGGSTTVLIFFTTLLMLKMTTGKVVFLFVSLGWGIRGDRKSSGNCEENRIFCVWSVELYFGIDFCFWLLYKDFIQKLLL